MIHPCWCLMLCFILFWGISSLILSLIWSSRAPTKVLLPDVIWANGVRLSSVQSKGKFYCLIEEWGGASSPTGVHTLRTGCGPGCSIGISSAQRGQNRALTRRAQACCLGSRLQRGVQLFLCTQPAARSNWMLCEDFAQTLKCQL